MDNTCKTYAKPSKFEDDDNSETLEELEKELGVEGELDLEEYSNSENSTEMEKNTMAGEEADEIETVEVKDDAEFRDDPDVKVDEDMAEGEGLNEDKKVVTGVDLDEFVKPGDNLDKSAGIKDEYNGGGGGAGSKIGWSVAMR